MHGHNHNQYEHHSSHLRREITFTTLGWLQSGAWQCLLMWLWASGRVPLYTRFWSTPSYSLLVLAAVTFWREVHFYWVHRGMHPWFDRRRGLLDGDVGAFLYRHAHRCVTRGLDPRPSLAPPPPVPLAVRSHTHGLAHDSKRRGSANNVRRRSLHHKSHNPGPWSGLSMHPIEHFLYYSCAWLG